MTHSRVCSLFSSFVFVVALSALLAVSYLANNISLRLQEKACRLDFAAQQTTVSLALENTSGHLIAANFKLELLDPQNHIRYRLERDEPIKPGTTTLKFDLSEVESKTTVANRDKLWFRLRYIITPLQIAAEDATLQPLAGFISASEITPDIFELQVFVPGEAKAGTRYQARVRTAHPITRQPISGVNISAEARIEIDDKEQKLKATGTSDNDGYAVLNFDLPKDTGESYAKLEIEFTAKRGSLEQRADANITLFQTDNYIINTDKTLYQPGQTIHTRVLLFDSNRQAKRDYEMDVEIQDPEEQKIFRTKIKTSSFGVANFDWKIPDNVRLGHYRIIVDKQSPTRLWGEATVKISRYDLPTFAVKAEPDHEFYLPGQDAEIVVKADYLFGQPVAKGKVKLIRESERTWNYRAQKYDVEEGEKYEGETDASGKFTAQIALAEQHEDFKDSNYRKYKDLHYAAYFTDATTGRTEQRRFDLRLTKEPIHLYLIHDENQIENYPLDFYVSASYADGAPAQCEIALHQQLDGEEKRLLRTIKTNRYGVAKVSDLKLAEDDKAEFVLLARDAAGKTGKLQDSINRNEDPVIRIATDSALYRANESIKATIKSNLPNARIVFETLQNNRILHSQMLELRDGQAHVTLPYKPEYKDEVTLVAYANVMVDESDEEFVYGSRTVLFPRDRELKLDVHLPRNDYQPGAEVKADLRVRSADGRATWSALGAVVVDTAVEERARTDNEFGGSGQRSYYEYFYGSESLSGVTRRDLDKLDLQQPIPADLNLVAEILLRDSGSRIRNHSESDYQKDQRAVFSAAIQTQLNPLKHWLETEYNTKAVYPKDAATLKRILRAYDINPEELRDPWGTAYHIGFLTEDNRDEMMLLSAGADKAFDTNDDFVALNIARLYFKFTGEAINRAVANYQARTGDCIRNADTLKAELKRAGIEFDALRDPWDTPYQISFRRNWSGFQLLVNSAGKNKQFDHDSTANDDDVQVWSAPLDYISEMRHRINQALLDYDKATLKFPGDEAAFRDAMQRGGIDFTGLRDPLGHRYYVTVNTRTLFTNHVEFVSQAKVGEKSEQKTEVIPVTQTVVTINVRGVGEDDNEGTRDDFDVTSFTRVVAEQSSKEAKPVKKTDLAANEIKVTPAAVASATASGLTGAIAGVVVDPAGAVISGVTVRAAHKTTGATYDARTNSEGVYFIKNLPPGLYDLRYEAAGFKHSLITEVQVLAAKIMQLNVTMEVGAVSEAVAVSASVESLQTTSATMANVVSKQIVNLPLNGRNALLKMMPGAATQRDISTPRLREYFPETLLWQPNIETDRQGRAQLKFKLADNITTWKLSLIGSTVDGQIGTIEKEIRAFQPFFAELDPPKVLTEGDEISLPVVLRNYLDKAQSVDLQFKPESWFTMLSPARKRSEVKPNDATKETFDFRAIASIKDGKQRVTAIGSTNSDAIEKAVSVHPDGEELANTVANVFGASGALDINVPEDAIKGSVQAELKIYPNLLAHVTEGIEGILRRPYGCGEQTISSTYPNVMALRLLKSTGQGEEGRTAAIAAKARKFANAGYERLLGYRAASGGFAYWSKGDADLALTAYALRFLNDASEVIAVNEDVIDAARRWLLKQQSADGRWAVKDYSNQEDARRSALYTALIARALTAGDVLSKEDTKALQKAFEFLALKLAKVDEPYALANYALAAQQANDQTRAKWAVEKLRTMPKDEAGGSYWALETNTPFYGWGLAGRIETTALVLKALGQTTGDTGSTEKRKQNVEKSENPALSSSAQSSPVRPVSPVVSSNELISKGVFWLLKNKDRYGVWLSTQATINVLDAFISLNDNTKMSGETTAEILLNGRRVNTVTLPPSNQLSNPIVVDLTGQLTTGNNRIEIKRPSNAALASAQLVETYYLPWSKSLATRAENFKPGQSRALRLAVNYDKPEAKIGDSITCQVEAERIGFAGYGMLLAEIGLPPGADVDRASLEAAVKEQGGSINHYDVLPERVVFYLWPRAGGCKFSFKFRSRFGTKAQSAASILYDYYNPEARAVIAPTRFVVR